MVVKTGFARFELVRFRAVACHCDEYHVVQGRLAADRAGDFVAVEARQSDVEQDHMGLVSQHFLEHGHAVVDDAHFVAVGYQQVGLGIGRVHIVVHDHHAARLVLPQGDFIWLRCHVRGRGGTERQCHDELAAFAQHAGGRDAAAVQFDQAFHQAQADAQAAARQVEGAIRLGK